MARIKYVINERRVAYEGAVKIITEGNEPPAQVEGAPEEAPKPAKVRKVEEPPVVHQTAAQRAAAGLLQPNSLRK
jgi:hypothetical protein